MGNQLTVKRIIQNIDEFKPDLDAYQLLDQNDFQKDKMTGVWQHKFTAQRLVERKYLARTQLELYELLENFSFRYNNNYVVASKYLIVQNSESIKKTNSQNWFHETYVHIFYEDSLINLSHFKQIPQQDAAYFLLQSLKGFESLKKKIKFPFEIKQQMFHVTANRQLKIWTNENITDLNSFNNLKSLPSQSYMIHQILQKTKSNVYFTTQSQKIIPIENCYMPPILIQELLKETHQNFQQVIQRALTYLNQYEIKIGSFMSCLKDLTNQELISLMMNQIKNKVVMPHYASSSNQNSGIFINNSSQISMKPYSLVNQFPYQPFQRNYSMGNLNNNQQSKYQTINSKVPQTIKNSRSKSNKKNGLSLIKNKQKNHQSQIILINQKIPFTSSVNQSPLNFKASTSKLPPRSSSGKKSNFTIPQQKENRAMLHHQNSKKLQLNNQHNRGISITKKQQSQQKQPRMVLNSQSLLERANNHLNTQFSNTINCSTVSVGPLPTPKYQNDSQARTAFNSTNMSVNFTEISPSQKFVPNQSLTRFQAENIFFNKSGTLNSIAQYYEAPRIYVHSPKAQKQFLRLDSMSTEQQLGQKQAYYQPNPTTLNNAHFSSQKQQDHVKEYQQLQSEVFYYPKNYSKQKITFETPNNTNKQINEFDSYIQENNQIFTHPKLYEYITNKKSDDVVPEEVNTKRTQQKIPKYIDYLSNVQISQSLDYHTADKLFSLGSNKQFQENRQKVEIASPNKFTLNDFPTIQQIQEPAHSYEGQKEDNVSFLPVQLKSNMNLGSKNQLSTIRRGQQQSLVVEYKKFYDDTNRSNNSPNKHYFSPLKKKSQDQPVYNQRNLESSIPKKYSTAEKWQASPPKPIKHQTNFNTNLFPINQNPSPPIIIITSPNSHKIRKNSPSPVSKVIYSGAKQPAINPLILQDMERIRQNRIC